MLSFYLAEDKTFNDTALFLTLECPRGSALSAVLSPYEPEQHDLLAQPVDCNRTINKTRVFL